MSNEDRIRQAIWKRKKDILKNLDTLTLKSVRRQLEGDLGLEKDALKPMKDFISLLLDKMIEKNKEQEVEPAEEAGRSSEEEDEEARPTKDRKTERGQDKKPRKKARRGPSEGEEGEGARRKPAAVARSYSRAVEKLRAMCRAATITIPPSLYVKNKDNAGLEGALEALLRKHGLDADSGEKAVARVKAKLAMARELEGIDTSNILDGGRRPRAAAQQARVNYAAMQRGGGSDSEEEEEEEEESEQQSGSDDGSDVEEELSAQSAGASEEEKEEEPAVASRPAAAGKGAAAAAASPDENRGPRSAGKAHKSAGKASAAAAKAELEDSDDDGTGAAPKAKQRRVLADWSDDDE